MRLIFDKTGTLVKPLQYRGLPRKPDFKGLFVEDTGAVVVDSEGRIVVMCLADNNLYAIDLEYNKAEKVVRH